MSVSLLAILVTSWLPRNVSGANDAQNVRCRSTVQDSSKKLPSFSELQIDFHNSYWVTESSPPPVIHSGKSPWITSPTNHASGKLWRTRSVTDRQKGSGTAYAASSRQPSIPRSSQCVITDTT